ncbi:MAG: CinA family nicotinamide mononucleotide deamidase-related protein [Desulfobulbaceae bacterium]|nr:CinA family nicotinamide mononucleotide deamidase-related protein [Desulfobulbaceae bacterium]
MIGEIIAIGDELTSGRIINTTSGFAARQLFAAGHEIVAMHTIGDTPALIGEALKRAIRRADFVIVTGGLGATSDDLTNEAVSKALNRPPTLHRGILNKIRARLRGGTGDQALLEKLAWLPQGAEVLNAESRMAGYLLVDDATPIFFLPGVPAQMKELMVEHVLPCLAGWSTDKRHHFRQRVYRTFGLGENMINEYLRHMEKTPQLKIGYYPVDSEVHVSLTVTGRDAGEADALFAEADSTITALLGGFLYGCDQETLASVVGSLLLQQNRWLGVAESCTGGLLAGKITETAGSSQWFAGGVVAYSNFLKEQLLDVDSSLLAEHGAVSAPVARAMAEGIQRRAGVEVAIGVTGIAGPSGGTDKKPVGTVFFGLCIGSTVTDQQYTFSGNRREIQEISAQTALDLVRRAL